MKKVSLVFLSFIVFMNMLPAKDYKGAEYRTIESFQYGRFEVRYKPPMGTGILATFFTYHDFTTSSADWNEVDIEILGRYQNDIQFTTITPYQKIHESHSFLNFNPAQDFHEYAFEWTPDYVAWFVDGLEYYRQTGDHIATLVHGQKIMANIWANDQGTAIGGWTGHWDPDILPVFAYYDWISYAAYTPDSGTTGTNNNFTPQWRDDLDSLNSARWQKATHTWPGNRVDLEPDNIIFRDGKMILALTDANNTGFVDHSPPKILWARAKGNKLTVRYSEEVDSSTAVNISKYNVPDISLNSIELLNDKRTVKLGTSAFDSSKSYTLVVFGMKDNSPDKNTQTYDVKTINLTIDPKFPLRINVGGESIYEGKYLADQVWTEEREYGYVDGYAESAEDSPDIGGTEEDSLYQTGIRKVVKYKVRVPNGIYDVILHFSENAFNSAGKRIFDIFVEESKIKEAFDIFAAAGKNHAYNVVAEDIAVHDGLIDMHFSNWTHQPCLFGITVEQKTTGIGRGSILPEECKLYQNYPNPFNPKTKIKYSIPLKGGYRGGGGPANLSIFNIHGQKVRTLVDRKQETGEHAVVFDAGGLASGLYFYRLTVGRQIFTKKMIVLK